MKTKSKRIAQLNKINDHLDREIKARKFMIKQNELALTSITEAIFWGLACVGAVVLVFISVINGGLV